MNESKLLGVSIRGWLSIIMVITTCIMSGFQIKVEEPLYSLVLMAVGFYLGQKTKGEDK